MKYHFIGIGGIGMGTLASLLLRKGCVVSGSDIRENSMTLRLQKEGAYIFLGHKATNIQEADCVVYSSAIALNNPEMRKAKEKNIPVLSRAQLLVHLMEGLDGITVAGAHGKTTTSAMIAGLLIKVQLSPSVAIGGIMAGNNNAVLGTGRYFVAELDESDGSFLNFQPMYSVITNMDFEHIDYYQNWDNILKAYRQFIHQTAAGGKLFICGDDERLLKLISESGKEYLTYGFSKTNDCRAENIIIEGFSTQFDCIFRGENLGQVILHVPGKYNILNALACISVGLSLSISFHLMKESLAEYQSVERRFQIKGRINGVQIIDDYAHHPTEIKAVIEAAQQLGARRLITVFQPHRYSRLQALFDEFVRSFQQSDYVVVTDIYAAGEDSIDGITAQRLVEVMKKTTEKPVVYVPRNQVEEYIYTRLQTDDVVLTLGAGDITHILRGDRNLFLKEGRQFFLNEGVVKKDKSSLVIGVLMGGYSSEREISLKSGQAVSQALKQQGYIVKEIDITEQDENKIAEQILDSKIDKAFITLHGKLGEDGTIQSILEKINISYVGSGVQPSRLAINKIETKKVLQENGIAVPKSRDRSHFLKSGTCPYFLPCVIKPVDEGSSIGISLVKEEGQWASALQNALRYNSDIFCEEYIKGRELTVGILGEEPLPVIEICTEKEFFNFTAKYNKGMTKYIVPAQISRDMAVELQTIALKVHKIIGCKDFSRVDFILSDEGIPYVLEINTIPGFTETSLLPMAAKQAGISFQQLCQQLIEMNIQTGLIQ